MSKRGNCYDNAAIESRNHSFKIEAMHGEKLLTHAQAKNMSLITLCPFFSGQYQYDIVHCVRAAVLSEESVLV